MKRAWIGKAVLALVLGAVVAMLVAPLVAARLLTYPAGFATEIGPKTAHAIGKGERALLSGKSPVVAQACCAHSFKVRPEGLRFEVGPKDPLIKNSMRSELRFASPAFARWVRYNARFMIDAPWRGGDELVIPMQWHAQRDLWLLEPGRKPPLEFNIRNNRLTILKTWQPGRWTLPGDEEVQRAILFEGPIMPGAWDDWRIEALWSPDANGRIRIWRGERLVVDDAGPNCYPDAVAPYWKAGVYIPHRKHAKDAMPSLAIVFARLAQRDLATQTAP